LTGRVWLETAMPPGLGKEDQMKKFLLVFFLIFLSAFFSPQLPAKETLTLASTTSTLDSGLFDALIPPDPSV